MDKRIKISDAKRMVKENSEIIFFQLSLYRGEIGLTLQMII